jgi:hypothetical protein
LTVGQTLNDRGAAHDLTARRVQDAQ